MILKPIGIISTLKFLKMAKHGKSLQHLLELVQTHVAQTGTLVLLVTHDPRDAQRFAGRTVLVADGVAQRPVPTADLFNTPPQSLQDYLGR